MKKRVKTSGGWAERDQTGVWHFTNVRAGEISQAINDVLHHDDLRPAWFWFNGAPCPVTETDTAESIENRWSLWEDNWDNLSRVLKTPSLLSLLDAMRDGNL